MTKLLVSVRSAAEAKLAAGAGVDLIDVKEPARGSLGAADLATIRAIAAAAPDHLPLSAALGELAEFDLVAELENSASSLLGGYLPKPVRFAKIGLAGMAGRADWPMRWQAALKRLPAQVTPVAVAYADYELSGSPTIDEVWQWGRRLGCGALLIDTYDKRGPGLLGWLGERELVGLRDATKRDGAWLVLAGSLTLETIGRLLPLEPDYVAVRGAACPPHAGRQAALDPMCLTDLVALVHGRSRRVAKALGTVER